jgi:sugar/nucleoside kinase (ribokinase family)
VTPAGVAGAAGHLDLLFSGTVFCDLVFAGMEMPEPGAEVFARAFTMSPGGAANLAVAGARLGSRTGLLCRLGADPLGRHVSEALATEPNLDLRWLVHEPGHQTAVTVSLTGCDEREFITYQEHLEPPGWAAGAPTVGATHVGIQSELPPWVRRLRSQGTQVFGGVGWDSSGAWSPSVLRRLAEVDVFVSNDLEAMRYTETTSAVEAARRLGLRVGLAIVTRGSRGVVAFEQSTGRLVEIPAVAVDAIDPTGAGDVFVASFMASGTLSWTLDHRLQLAALCGALSVRTLGGAASAPRPADIVAFLAEHDPPGDFGLIHSWAVNQ